MPLFDRVIKVTVGPPGQAGFAVQDFHISFDVVKTDTSSANTCSVEIWNLAQDSRDRIKETDHAVILEAGYVEDTGLHQLYVGQVTTATHLFRPPDWITKIDSGDGAQPLRETRVSLSYRSGTSVGVVLKQAMSSFGLPQKGLPADIPSGIYAQGLSYSGPARDIMDKICDRLGLEWSIQSGQIQVLKKRGSTTDTAVLLTPESGLLRPPEPQSHKGQHLAGAAGKGGYRISCLLQPIIEPGRLISVESRTASGFFRVDKITHRGDNTEGDFISELEVSRL